jgi:hypothetical protein
VRLAVVAVLAACGHPAAPAPAHAAPAPALEPFVPVATEADIAPRCHARPGNGLAIDGDTSDAPFIVLREIHLHGSGPSSPRIAVWEDGTVIFERGSGRRRATLPLAAVQQLQREILNDIAGEPRGVTRSDMDGGIITDVIVRDGATWHVVHVYGADEEEFLATAAGHPPALDSDTFGPAGSGEFHFQPEPLPRNVAIAYRTLLDARPTSGVTWEPSEYDLEMYGMPVGERRHAHGHIYPWPAGLPKPPATLLPTACEIDGGSPCLFALDPRYAELVKPYEPKKGTWPSVVTDGHEFKLQLYDHYRGQRTIDAIDDCARKVHHDTSHD